MNEKKDDKKKDDAWFKWLYIFLTVVVIGAFAGGLINNAIEKSYLGSLTPEERAELKAEQIEKEEAQRLEQERLNEENAKAWSDITLREGMGMVEITLLEMVLSIIGIIAIVIAAGVMLYYDKHGDGDD